MPRIPTRFTTITKARAREILRESYGTGRMLTREERQEIGDGAVTMPHETFLGVLQRIAEDDFNWEAADMETRQKHFASLT